MRYQIQKERIVLGIFLAAILIVLVRQIPFLVEALQQLLP